MAYKALDIAKKLIKLADYDTANGGDNLTNLRLQKLLYYEQGYHLAQFGTTLFDEEIEAWMYGLVVPSVYEYYHPNGSKPLPVPEDNELITMTDDEEVMFAQVFEATMKVRGLLSIEGGMG